MKRLVKKPQGDRSNSRPKTPYIQKDTSQKPHRIPAPPPARHTRPQNTASAATPKTTSPEQSRGKGQFDEIKLCGYNACQQVHKTRAEDIIRVYLVEDRLEEFSELVKSCVRRRKAYHVVSTEDMNKISGSTHHEGVCIIAKRRLPLTWELFLSTLEDRIKLPEFVIIIEEVSNPHNIGAIVRSAANFGCKYILLPNDKDFKPSAALMRTAEGGGEFVEFIAAPSIATIATELRLRGMSVFGTAMKGRIQLYHDGEAGKLPSRMAMILGNESRGISAEAKKAAHGIISIPGNGSVQSLNVGVASALIVGEYYRQHGVLKTSQS